MAIGAEKVQKSPYSAESRFWRYPTGDPRDAQRAGHAGPWAGNESRVYSSPAAAIASRWSLRSVLMASRAFQRSTLATVIAAWERAWVAL